MRDEKPWVKPVTDYLPLAAFFAVYFGWDLLTATAALLAATLAALGLSLAVNRRVPVMPLVTAGLVAVFGGLTLAFDDETFIKMKPTVAQGLIAAVLYGGLLFGKPLLKPVIGAAVAMDDAGWRKLTRNCAGFFLAMAALNELVWRTQSTDFWVTFKVFGIAGMTFAFLMAQIMFLARHRV